MVGPRPALALWPGERGASSGLPSPPSRCCRKPARPAASAARGREVESRYGVEGGEGHLDTGGRRGAAGLLLAQLLEPVGRHLPHLGHACQELRRRGTQVGAVGVGCGGPLSGNNIQPSVR